MGISHQLKGMLKCHFIQMKRNKLLSCVEIFCPVIILLFYFFIRLLFSVDKEEYKSIYLNDAKFLINHSTNLTNKITSKDQNSFDDINETSSLPYTYFLAQCKYTKHVAIIGNDFPEKLKNKISSHFWELDDYNESDFYKIYESIDEFDKYITSEIYGTDEKLYPKICFGISKIDKFKFGIHYNTINVNKESKNELENLLINESPHIPESKSKKNEAIKTQENMKFFEYYKNSGYLMAMKLIYDYILQEITNDTDAEINFSVIGMKYNYILKDKFHSYLSLLNFFIIISYSIIFSINIYREINFRETKKKEYLKSMGVKERTFFFSFFIRSFTVNLVHSFLGSLVVKLFLKQSQYEYILIILFLFGLIIFSMSYFFQSFLQQSRNGVILSLLCFCIMTFLYLPINSPEINEMIIYSFCILFPPTNLILGLNVLYIFEKEFCFFNNNIKMNVAQITIFQMITFFIISFFFYLILGFIISELFCYKYGRNKHSCCKKKYSNINNSKLNSINKKDFRINENLKTITNKKSEFDILSNLGNEYIDEKEEEHHLSKKKKEIKVMTYDLMNTPRMSPAYNQKIEYLKSLLIKDNKQNNNSPETNEIHENNFIKNELETDFENINELQEIRSRRREGTKTMYNLYKDEDVINKNLQLSDIKYIIPQHETFLSERLEEILNDNSFIEETINGNEMELKDGEYIKIKNNINNGARLEIENVIKNYGNKNILDGVSCTLLKNEIFVLLGENGAGKSTLISILSGLIDVPSGRIIYKNNKEDNGVNITTSSGIERFRKILGVCPQNNNILFEDLTVRENLEMFCLLKYDKKREIKNEENNQKNQSKLIEEEVSDLLEQFDLVGDKLAKDLSGGQKRKLSIAIACCGRSEVIILDEPTGGIDIYSRKSIWNILKELKNHNKIILLITHFMDEASLLGDQIAILKNGKIVIQGTNRQLIDKFGQYISIKINKKLDYHKIYKIVEYIKKNNYINYINEDISIIKDLENEESKTQSKDKKSTELTIGSYYENTKNQIYLETYRERIIIRIPTKNFNFSKAFKLLEYLEKKNIRNYVIVKDQLEDVFINIMSNSIKDKKDYLQITNLNEIKEKDDIKNDNYRCFGKFINDLKISFLKRLKDYKTIITEILFPVILTLIACLVSYIEWLEENKSSYIDLNTFSNDSQTIFFEFSNISNFEDYYQILYSDASDEKKKLKNYNFKYLNNFGGNENYTLSQNIIGYMNTIYRYSENQSISNNTASFYLISADQENHKYEFATFISSKKSHSSVAFTNYLLSRIIKYEIKKTDYKQYLDDIGIINSPFLLTYEERKNKKSRNGSNFIFFISIGLSLIPSNFIINIIREKENKSKHLQILSGLSLLVYWLNNYIFEIGKFFFISLFSLFIMKIFNFFEYYMIILYALYGPALISFTYCLSYFLNAEGSGQVVALLVNLFFGTLGGSAMFILRTNKSLKKLGENISFIFRLVPSFCITYGFNELLSKEILFGIDNYKEKMNEEELNSLKNKYNNSKYAIDYIKIDFIYLSIEIVAYTILLIILENKDYFTWKFSFKRKKTKIGRNEIEDNNDEEISKDNSNNEFPKKRFTIRQENNIKNNYILRVSNLTKKFGFKCKKKRYFGINKLSFKVENGECFGLIGENGAGKTTTFKCLCKEIKPDEGMVTINQFDIFEYSLSRKKPTIGYCPQFDSVFEYLTVDENLNFFGRLKGVKEENLSNVVNTIMKKLDLEKFKDVKCKKLSGGNKRKLSVGISIMGYPNIIFMDEPSTGMDPYTRRLLMDLLNKAYLKNQSSKSNKNENDKRGIILTTHSIEEVEALCDKIGILQKGSINNERIGTINDIVQKYSKCIELNVEFKKINYIDIKEKYEKKLKNLKDEYTNIEDVKILLGNLDKEQNEQVKYINYLDEKNFGKEIIDLIKRKKSIKIYTILIWKEYLGYIFKLVKKIKKYYKDCPITCIKYKINNIILKIENKGKKNKCDSFLFGIMEEFKKELKIEEYSYFLSSLESIFLDICSDKSNERNIKIQKEKIKDQLCIEL